MDQAVSPCIIQCAAVPGEASGQHVAGEMILEKGHVPSFYVDLHKAQGSGKLDSWPAFPVMQ